MQALRILDIKADRALENVVVRLDIDLPDIDASIFSALFSLFNFSFKVSDSLSCLFSSWSVWSF